MASHVFDGVRMNAASGRLGPAQCGEELILAEGLVGGRLVILVRDRLVSATEPRVRGDELTALEELHRVA